MGYYWFSLKENICFPYAVPSPVKTLFKSYSNNYNEPTRTTTAMEPQNFTQVNVSHFGVHSSGQKDRTRSSEIDELMHISLCMPTKDRKLP